MKIRSCFLLAFLIFVSVIFLPRETAAGMDTVRFINERADLVQNKDSEEIKLEGYIPIVRINNRNSNIAASQFESELNKKIQEIKAQKITTAKNRKAKIVEFSYTDEIDGNNFFIKIITIYKSTTITGTVNIIKKEMDTVNFNIAEYSYKSITLNDVLGPNGLELINKYIHSEIRKAPSKFVTNFNEVTGTQDFYVKDNTVFIVFDSGEIIPGSKEIFNFEIPFSKIQNFDVEKNKIYTITEYNIKMIPLRIICDFFEYEIKWNHSTSSIIILKDDWRTSISINMNSYFKGTTKTAPSIQINLETPPELRDGVTYVPISFYEEIMGLSYSVDADGNVVFSKIED